MQKQAESVPKVITTIIAIRKRIVIIETYSNTRYENNQNAAEKSSFSPLRGSGAWPPIGDDSHPLPPTCNSNCLQLNGSFP